MANKLLLYQASIFLVLYVGYAFYYYTRKSIVFMLPHFGRNTTNSIEITKNDIGALVDLTLVRPMLFMRSLLVLEEASKYGGLYHVSIKSSCKVVDYEYA